MSAFARAAELFERVAALPAPEREAALAEEADDEVRALATEMLAGESDPQTWLEKGLPALGGVVAGALADESGSAVSPSAEDLKLELADSPYRVLGLLASGGMGVVLRGRDEEIGRNVAIKVLRQHQREDARLRFIEEAQVAGQLEHPGIVPVYHLGTDDAGRPFFAMKLVEGETLAACLEQRAHPREDRARFLGLFLQVCQTLAYAHSRRVIHRDLKPANVMVGGFGEVQVLDWGLAKVLGRVESKATGVAEDERVESGPADQDTAPQTVRTRSGSGSASVYGTVMGTPRYIPPEQAQGEVERLDERADVFSLGAILCEILTGEPPFTGEREEALEAAREGRVEPAMKRLAACGADQALIAITQRSLSVVPAQRPADASELAAEVERSLAAVEERAHSAELAAESARARADSERRARRLTVVFTAGAAVFAVVLVAVFQWRAYERERDVLQLSGEVAAALDRAAARIEVALAAPLDEPAPWDAAALALEAAESILSGGETTSAVRERLDGMRAEFEASSSVWELAAAELARDRAMAARLEEIRVPTGDGIDPYDYARMQAEYRTAFADYGIDTEDSPAASALLVQSDIVPVLAQALDQWALCHRTLAVEGEDARHERADALLELAAAADPDPTRNRVRAALRSLDATDLRALAEEAKQDPSFAPESILLIGGGLRAIDDPVAAALLLKKSVRRHRGDFWLSFHAALALRAMSGDLRSEEALAYFHGALGARPDSREARHLYGQTLQALGRSEEALQVFEELNRTDPDYGHGFAHTGELIIHLRGWHQALLAVTEAARLAPYDSYVQTWYGRTLEETGSVWQAVAPLERAAELERNLDTLGRLGAVLSHAGRSVEALTTLEESIELGAQETTTLYNAGSLAWELGNLERAEELLRRCIALHPEFPQAHCNLGAVLRELGRYDEARDAYERCNTLGLATRGWSYPSADWMVAMERAAIYADEIEVYVEGGFDPTAGPSALEVADVALALDWTAAASDFYFAILETEGELSLASLELAAGAAARASAGDGLDARELSPEERRAQAELAFSWLDRIRTELMDDFRADPTGELGSTRSWLECWTVEPTFQALRDLSREPFPDEPLRAAATRFWSAVDQNLREIADRFE